VAQQWRDGLLMTVKMRGPDSYECWLECWKVFRSAMIMVDAASVADLDRYSKSIENLLRTFNYWPQIQETEDVVRRERWNILAETVLEKKSRRCSMSSDLGPLSFARVPTRRLVQE
jgi:hypothetical protein